MRSGSFTLICFMRNSAIRFCHIVPMLKNERMLLYMIRNLEWHVSQGLNLHSNRKGDAVLENNVWSLGSLNIVGFLGWEMVFGCFQ